MEFWKSHLQIYADTCFSGGINDNFKVFKSQIFWITFSCFYAVKKILAGIVKDKYLFQRSSASTVSPVQNPPRSKMLQTKLLENGRKNVDGNQLLYGNIKTGLISFMLSLFWRWYNEAGLELGEVTAPLLLSSPPLIMTAHMNMSLTFLPVQCSTSTQGHLVLAGTRRISVHIFLLFFQWAAFSLKPAWLIIFMMWLYPLLFRLSLFLLSPHYN